MNGEKDIFTETKEMDSTTGRSAARKRSRATSDNSRRNRRDRTSSPERKKMSRARTGAHKEDTMMENTPRHHARRHPGSNSEKEGNRRDRYRMQDGPNRRRSWRAKHPGKSRDSFEEFRMIIYNRPVDEWNPDDLCMFLALNQNHFILSMDPEVEDRAITDKLIRLLRLAVVEATTLCDNSRQQLVTMLRTCNFFESRLIIRIVKSLVTTKHRNPDEEDMMVVNDLLDVMLKMVTLANLPREDTIVFLGSLRSALKAGKIIVREEDLALPLLDKTHTIETTFREPVSSDVNHDMLEVGENAAHQLGPILPNFQDIRNNSKRNIAPRRVLEPFASATEYIQYIFLSFREDFIGPLCRGIRDYVEFVTSLNRNQNKKAPKFWNQDVQLYENVHVLGTELSNGTDTSVVIQIDASRIKNFSSRLIYGSLVCLSDDEFHSGFYATVSDRKVERLKSDGTLLVQILDSKQVDNSLDEEVNDKSSDAESMEWGEENNTGAPDGAGTRKKDCGGRSNRDSDSGDKTTQDLIKSLQGREFVMLESKAFYVTYLHPLQSLKTMYSRVASRQASLPFKKQLLQMSKVMSAPSCFEASDGHVSFECMMKYALKNIADTSRRLAQETTDQTMLEQSSPRDVADVANKTKDPGSQTVLDVEIKKSLQKAKKTQYHDKQIDRPNDWPSAEELGLDDSQYAALRLTLTHEVALIQGPPGTGKTTLGIRIAELLLENEHLWRRDENNLMKATPLLLLSYTNHALDQFLIEILKLPAFCDDPPYRVVRVGSRSEHLMLVNHNISELRREIRNDTVSLRHEKQRMRESKEIRHELIEEMKYYRNGIVHHEYLKAQGVCLETHYRSLTREKQNAVPIIMDWLCLDKLDFGFSLDQNGRYIHGSRTGSQLKKHTNQRSNETQWAEHNRSKSSNNESVLKNNKESTRAETTKLNETEEGEIKDKDKEEEDFAEHFDDNDLNIHEHEMDLELERTLKLDMDATDDDEQYDSDSNQDEEQFFCDDEKDVDTHPDRNEEIPVVAISIQDEFREVIWHFPLVIPFPAEFLSRMVNKIQDEVNSNDTMTDEEEQSVYDVWQLDITQRWRLYRLWLKRLLGLIQGRLDGVESELKHMSIRVEEIRALTDLCIMRNARVVAMTTTGAARCSHLLQQLKARVVLVEEAAQVTEAHVLSALTPACKHLIMIGDHQQLRPSYCNFDLTARRHQHHIDISLFERLCCAGVPFQRLSLQHRMRPEMSSLLVPTIYSELKDHPCVLQYPKIKGVSASVFFVNHSQLEDKVEESRSKRNSHEADFLASLYMYLRLQGYSAEDITVLALYKDQALLLRKLIKQMENDPRLTRPKYTDFSSLEDYTRDSQRPAGPRVTPVDNFQGEESRIVLLSLVRSNKGEVIGHLKEENRVCVALSRAKEGLFVIGNCSMLSKKSPKCWKPILEKVKKSGRLGKALPLYCERHDHVTHVTCHTDIERDCKNGGCNKICDYRLTCGHTCGRVCHASNMFHKDPCKKPCVRTCPSGHGCESECGKWPCPPCKQKCQKQCSAAGHPCNKTCGQSCDPCEARCEKLLGCGHRCQARCGYPCTALCMELVKVKKECGHEFQAACYLKENASCTVPCNTLLQCGHTCKGKCGECFAGRLHVACRQPCQRVLVCGHLCSAPCTKNCPPCRKKCGAKCPHSGRACNMDCSDQCQPCNELCAWRCKRGCRNFFKCTKLCRELCDRPRCDVPCRSRHECGNCKKKYPCRGLFCEDRCPRACPKCDSDIRDIFFGTEDEKDARFYQLPDCPKKCVFEVSGLDQYMNTASDSVGHIQCPKCRTPILTALRYGNIIKKANEDVQKVKKKLLVDTEDLSVFQDQIRSPEFIAIRVDPDFADLISRKKIEGLKSHQDQVKLKNQLNFAMAVKKLKNKIVNITAPELKSRLVPYLVSLTDWIKSPGSTAFSEQQLTEFQTELVRAKFVFSFGQVYSMLSRASTSDTKTSEKLEIAEKCIQRLMDTPSKLSLQEEAEMNESLEKIRPANALGISETERIMILKAMNFKQGHWYKCKNGHVYAIGECGGAMEEAQCPACRAPVGGRNHRLADGNAVAQEMDGATYGAWSEQANLANYDIQFL